MKYQKKKVQNKDKMISTKVINKKIKNVKKNKLEII